MQIQTANACLHFLTSKYQVTQVGTRYKSNPATHITRMTIASQTMLSAKISKIDQSKLGCVLQLGIWHLQLGTWHRAAECLVSVSNCVVYVLMLLYSSYINRLAYNYRHIWCISQTAMAIIDNAYVGACLLCIRWLQAAIGSVPLEIARKLGAGPEAEEMGITVSRDHDIIDPIL